MILDKVSGIQTIESVSEILDVSSSTAGYYVDLLRKAGFVKTKRTSSGKRIYNISRQNKIGGTSYYEVLNAHSPIKLSEAETYKVYGRDPSCEETLIYAIKTQKLRVVLAALSLFGHITNWTVLGRLARQNNVQRKVCALYDVARKIMKTRRMSKQFRLSCEPGNMDAFLSVVPALKSKDFKDIENHWRVHIPFNVGDLEEYKVKW